MGKETESNDPDDNNDGKDDFGYATDDKDPDAEQENDGVVPTEDDESEGDDEEEEDKTKEKKKEKKTSGYGDDLEEEIPEDKPEEKEKTPEELTAEEALDKELTETLKDLGDNFDAEKIKAFAKEHKFTPAQVKAYKDMLKKEEAESIQENQKAQKLQRTTWLKELKADKEFGGANFDTNVDRVEKLLENNMPNVKKMLTDKKGMLPPVFMKDLLSLAKALNPKTKLVTGEPSAPKEKAGSFLTDLYK